jgi:beta-glucuronidase
VNGQEAMSHEGGHLPFEAEVTNMLQLDGSNYVTVAMNNTLTPTTLPPGAIEYKTNPEK